ncbi:oxygenase MpaB family protein [Nocardia sp. NPDC051030]|uniref:oxygenase MpaB family protein n=1 Tax=Nocardia sp. NPDC051030 TaxID=3155162 RepID=UPI00341C933F
MTCPVNHSPAESEAVTTATDDTVARFQRFAGSWLVGFFAAGLFDQTMLPAVSGALEDTGRFRNAPFERALRSAASDQIMFAGDADDRRAEAERLMRLHRDVKGVGYNGIRYSALNPESWNWILISTFFVYRAAFVTVTGERLSAADNQKIWDHFRELVDGLQLPGRSRLIENYSEMCAYYDRMVGEKLESTRTLENVVGTLRRPPLPGFLPRAIAPAWKLAGPVAGHVSGVLGYGIMHPGVRAITPTRWTKRHDLEFAVLTKLLALGYRHLPQAITETPLTRNRRKYTRLMGRYQNIGLTSFAPDNISKVMQSAS